MAGQKTKGNHVPLLLHHNPNYTPKQQDSRGGILSTTAGIQAPLQTMAVQHTRGSRSDAAIRTPEILQHGLEHVVLPPFQFFI